MANLTVSSSSALCVGVGQKAGPPPSDARCQLSRSGTTQELGRPIASHQKLQELLPATPPPQGLLASAHDGEALTTPTTVADSTLLTHARSAQELLVGPTRSRQYLELHGGLAPDTPPQADPCGGGGCYTAAEGMLFAPAVMLRSMRAQAHTAAEAAAAEACRLMLRTSTLQVGGTALHHCPPPLHPQQQQQQHHESHCQGSFLMMSQQQHHHPHHHGHAPQQQHASSYQSSFLMHLDHSPQPQHYHLHGYPPQQQSQESSHQSSFPLIELRQASMTRLVSDPVGEDQGGDRPP